MTDVIDVAAKRPRGRPKKMEQPIDKEIREVETSFDFYAEDWGSTGLVIACLVGLTKQEVIDGDFGQLTRTVRDWLATRGYTHFHNIYSGSRVSVRFVLECYREWLTDD